MLSAIVIVIVLLLLILLAVAATRPDSFRIERSIQVAAPPEKLYAIVSDFQQWAAWSPWEKLDPTMQKTHSGAARGLGAIYEWQGNNKVGQGRMEITGATPPAALTIKLDFLKPFEAHNTAEFSFKGADSSTEVIWAMHGPSPFLSKLMGLFFSMDKMVGKDFEAGLSSLKALAEKS